MLWIWKIEKYFFHLSFHWVSIVHFKILKNHHTETSFSRNVNKQNCVFNLFCQLVIMYILLRVKSFHIFTHKVLHSQVRVVYLKGYWLHLEWIIWSSWQGLYPTISPKWCLDTKIGIYLLSLNQNRTAVLVFAIKSEICWYNTTTIFMQIFTVNKILSK